MVVKVAMGVEWLIRIATCASYCWITPEKIRSPTITKKSIDRAPAINLKFISISCRSHRPPYLAVILLSTIRKWITSCEVIQRATFTSSLALEDLNFQLYCE